MLYRLFADGKLLGDLTIGKAGYDGSHDIELAARQTELFLRLCVDRRRRFVKGFQKVGDFLLPDPELTLHDHVDALEQHTRRGVLQNDRSSAELQCLDDLLCGDRGSE